MVLARMDQNPYLKCRQMLVKTGPQIMECSGAQVKMCGREEPALPGISAGDGIRLPRFYKMPGIPRIRERLKPYCIPGGLTEDQPRVGMVLRSRLIIRGCRLTNPIGIKKCIQIPGCGLLPDRSLLAEGQTG